MRPLTAKEPSLSEGKEPVFDINSNVSLLLEDLIKAMPDGQKKIIQPLNPTGMINMTAGLKGTGLGLEELYPQCHCHEP